MTIHRQIMLDNLDDLYTLALLLSGGSDRERAAVLCENVAREAAQWPPARLTRIALLRALVRAVLPPAPARPGDPRLPAAQMAAVALTDSLRLPYTEMAEVLGVPEPVAVAWLRDGREVLRNRPDYLPLMRAR